MKPNTQYRVTPAVVSGVVAGTDDFRSSIDDFVTNDYGKVVASVALAAGNRELAEDGVQNALVKALAGNKRPTSLAAWVTVVATNEVRQMNRRKAIEHRVVESTPVAEAQSPPDRAVAIDLENAISSLPNRQREIALLFYYLDISVADIANAMNITQGTVKTQLHRAREALAERLGTTPPDDAGEVANEH